MHNERLLQFLWQFQLYNKNELVTTTGDVLQILQHGVFNTNQGPDFLHASIKLNGLTLVGNIEVHVRASDWKRHQHQNDANYCNIILHVVWDDNADIKDKNGTLLPTLILQDRVAKHLLSNYEILMHGKSHIPCQSFLPALNNVGWIAWKERLAVERLEQKSSIIIQRFNETKHHWEEVFWQTIAYNFGLKVNALLFEEVAKSISINILAKHKNQIHQIEALLLGQANLLNETFTEHYPNLLQREWHFLQKKYKLEPIDIQPAFLRMRPAAFPTVRLAQLAMLIHKSSHLFVLIKEADTVQDVLQLLDVTANDYWHYHYKLDEESEYHPKTLGKATIESIVINTVIPVLFAYGLHSKDQAIKDKALAWLYTLSKEKNNITEQWMVYKIENKNALDSQALIQLNNCYCKPRLCLQCAVGTKVLRQNAVV